MAKYRSVRRHKNSQKARKRRDTIKAKMVQENEVNMATLDDGSPEAMELEANENDATDMTLADVQVPQGRRLTSIDYLLNSMNKAYDHGRSCISKGSLQITKERQVGLQSKITFKCTGCSFNIIHDTDSSKDCTLPVNDAIVWGTYAAGSTYTASEHLFTVLDVPFLSFPKYQREERTTMSSWDDMLYETLLKNGEDEVKLAKAAGDILNVEGTDYPFTTVTVDAAWSSRSYGHSYKSKGGVAVILSRTTGKLLFVGIRNRFCVICKRQESTGLKRQHLCFKNWDADRSAQSMEADMILEGFRCSIDSHGLVYKRLVGDGDSSVFMTLICSNIYPGVEIEKIECVNHAVKRFNKSLLAISENTQLYALSERNLLKKNVHRFGLALRSAIIYNHKSENPSADILRKDILNIPYHIFGEHVNCRDYFCTPERKAEQNLVPQIIDQPIWNSIQAVISRAANISSRLLPNMTTNTAESFMNRVAKYNMGKRVNHILKGGWHLRVIAAALSYEYGPCFYTKVFKLLTGTNPGIFWTRALTRASKIVKTTKHRVRRLFHGRIAKNVVAIPNKRFASGDAEYGSNPAYPDMSDNLISQLVQELIFKKQVSLEMRNQIESQTIGQSSNSRWIYHRNGRITASLAGHLYSLRDSTNNKVTLDKLLRPSSLGHVKSVQHGQDYEGPAKRAYTAKTGNVVTECGLFISLENGIFAASPDGLVGENGIVEIKCPSSLIGHPPTSMPTQMKNSYLKPSPENSEILKLCHSSNYYKQVVMQLHVTGRDWCDFVVYTFKTQDKVIVQFDPFVERIYRSNETLNLWNSMKTKFEKFYKLDVAPEIVDSRIDRSLIYRQPQYRRDAINKVQMSKTIRTAASNIRRKYQKKK